MTLNNVVSQLMTTSAALDVAEAKLAALKFMIPRWGVDSCAPGTLVFDGIMAGAHYTHHGGANYLCIAKTGNSGQRNSEHRS